MKIVLKDCGKNYHRTWLFRNVNFEFEVLPGNSLAVLGDNGSGKSTLTLLLTRQIEPTEGIIEWTGTNPKDVHNLYSSSLLEATTMHFFDSYFEIRCAYNSIPF